MPRSPRYPLSQHQKPYSNINFLEVTVLLSRAFVFTWATKPDLRDYAPKLSLVPPTPDMGVTGRSATI